MDNNVTNATIGLTWTADKGLGTHGGFRCAERPLVILRDANRHYALYQDGAKGLPGDEVGHLAKGSLAKCKAEAEAFARCDADLAALDAQADAYEQAAAVMPTLAALPEDQGRAALEVLQRLTPPPVEPEPTDAEVEAAYDRTCPCLPEIEAACPVPADEPPALTGEDEQGPDPTAGCEPALSADTTAAGTPAPASDVLLPTYTGFAVAAQARGWTDDQLCECEMPDIAAFRNAVGQDQFEAWAVQLLDDRAEQARSGRTEAQVQAAVDQLVWQHGRTNRPGLLAPFKLTEADLTADRLLRAEQNVKARIYADGPLTWHGPAEEQNGVGPMDVWKTGDGRYRIGRYRGAEPRFAVEARIGGGARRLVANNLKSLEAALDAADNHYRGLVGEEPQGNRAKVLKKAEESGRARLPRPEEFSYNNGAHNPSPEARKAMFVNETEARQMLVSMGAKSHADSPRKLLTRVLNDLHNRIDAMKAAPQGEDKKLCDAILASLEAGEEIVIKSDPSNPSPEKEKAMKNGTAKGSNRTKPSPQSGGTGTDRFGSRLGSVAAKANAVLGKKPIRMAEIMAKAGLSESVYNHLNKLVEKGMVAKSKEGYSLAK